MDNQTAVEVLKTLIERRKQTDVFLQTILEQGFVSESEILRVVMEFYSKEFEQINWLYNADDLVKNGGVK